MPKRPDPYLVDDENPEATVEDFRRMRPAAEVLSRELYESLVAKYDARQATRGDRQMKGPGLDARHCDRDGRIQQKRCDTLNLSHTIPGFPPDTALGEMRKRAGPLRKSSVRREAHKEC